VAFVLTVLLYLLWPLVELRWSFIFNLTNKVETRWN